MKLSAREILCSSVDGYRLEVGARTSDTLRAEIIDAAAFLAIVTPHSIASSYVLFELGARWGAAKHILPLLARGATPAAIPGPLVEVNCLNLAYEEQIIQFAEALANLLRRPLEPYASFLSAINGVAIEAAAIVVERAAREETLVVDRARETPSEDRIKELALMKMKAGIKKYPGGAYVSTLAKMAGISVEDATEYLTYDPDVRFDGAAPPYLKAVMLK